MYSDAADSVDTNMYRSLSLVSSDLNEDVYAIVNAALATDFDSHPLQNCDEDEEKDEDEHVSDAVEDIQDADLAHRELSRKGSRTLTSPPMVRSSDEAEGPDDWLEELEIKGRCMVGSELRVVRRSGRPLPDNVAVFWQRVRSAPEEDSGMLTVQIPEEAEERYAGTTEDCGACLRVVAARRLGPYSLGKMGFSMLSDPIVENLENLSTTEEAGFEFRHQQFPDVSLSGNNGSVDEGFKRSFSGSKSEEADLKPIVYRSYSKSSTDLEE
eukprot:3307607-Pyramimonas_sp.AAC.1